MNKKIALGLALIMAVTLVGCGKSKLVKSAEDAICNIGEVSLDSLSMIEEAERIYQVLSDKEKETVENRDALLDARKKYNDLAAEKEKEEKQLAKEKEEKEKQLARELDKLTDAVNTHDVSAILECCDIILPLAEELGASEAIDTVKNIKDLIPSTCYENTPLMKPEYVVSPEITTIKGPSPENGFVWYTYTFSSLTALNKALDEYCDYVKKYYKTDKIEEGCMYFKTENGKTIMVSGWDFGDYGGYLMEVRFDDGILN